MTKLKTIALGLGAIWMANSMPSGPAAAASDVNGRIHGYVLDIQQISDPRAAEVKVGDLSKYVQGLPQSAISQRSIDEVIGLLASRSDRIREGAAITLAAIGPKARRAEPALRAALNEPELKYLEGPGGVRYQTNHTSEFAIRDALVKIGAEKTMDFSGGSKKKGELTEKH